jgi:hypothetical protein
LKYLDYKDNKSFVTLPTKATSNIEDDTVKLQLAYDEPSGKVVTSSDWLWLSSDAKELAWDGEEDPYAVTQFNLSDTSLTLIVQKSGRDNNKNATIRKTILVRGKTLTIAKQVKYKQSRKFFLRNTYSFIRE